MSTNTLPQGFEPSLLFATTSATADDTRALIELAIPLMDASGRIPWAKVEEQTGIGYSRGWLIVRRAYLEAFQPNLIVDLAGLIAEGRKIAAEKGQASTFDEIRDVVAPIAAHHRDDLTLSWGEIAVRLGIPESKVRSAYRATGGKKDLGLRIGKGGRFAYGDPTLYLDNMKTEGAHIALDEKGRPVRERCLNFRSEEATEIRPAKKSKSA